MRHNTLADTLESVERANRLLLKRENKEPEKGQAATLITAWTRQPATIVMVQPRRMLVQEDLVSLSSEGRIVFHRNLRGVIHGFRRRIGTQKWSYASDWLIRGQRTLGVIVGERLYEEPEIGEDL